MSINIGIFGDSANFDDRYIVDYERLERTIESIRELHPHAVIVATSGTYDLLGIGHARYLNEAKKLGDILVVGVDSDAKTKRRKGEHRPIVDESERLEMLTHLRYVDIVTIKDEHHEHLQFLKTVQPDILVISQTNEPSQAYLDEVAPWCKQVVLLEPQAKSSTSSRIRALQTGLLSFLNGTLVAEIEKAIQAAAEKYTGKPLDETFQHSEHQEGEA